MIKYITTGLGHKDINQEAKQRSLEYKKKLNGKRCGHKLCKGIDTIITLREPRTITFGPYISCFEIVCCKKFKQRIEKELGFELEVLNRYKL